MCQSEKGELAFRAWNYRLTKLRILVRRETEKYVFKKTPIQHVFDNVQQYSTKLLCTNPNKKAHAETHIREQCV